MMQPIMQIGFGVFMGGNMPSPKPEIKLILMQAPQGRPSAADHASARFSPRRPAMALSTQRLGSRVRAWNSIGRPVVT